MSTFESFLPDSPFGVPVHPFPPGVKWNTTQEMIDEILVDLKLPWVQDFILRSHPRQDVHALSDPSNYSRATSGTLEYKSIPHLSGGFTSHMQSMRLLMPVISIDNIAVGIFVEDSKLSAAHKVLLLKTMQFSRFVCNNRKHSLLLIRLMEDLRKVIVSYTAYAEDGVWFYVNVHIEYAAFFSAFDRTTSAVDFYRIYQGITRTTVTGIPYRNKPLTTGNPRYPNKVTERTGDFFVRGSVCVHFNGEPLRANAVFSNTTYSFNYDAKQLRRMQNWGISDRLQLIPVSLVRNPKMSITGFLLNKDREPERAITMGHHQPGSSASSMHVYAHVSAPEGHVPFPTRTPAASSGPSLSRNQVANIAPRGQFMLRPEKQLSGKEAKKEQRKIRKREAAARSYQSKLAKSKNSSTQDET